MDERDYKELIGIYENQLMDHMEQIRDERDIPMGELEKGKCLLSAITKAQTAIAMKNSGVAGRGYSNAGDDYSGAWDRNSRNDMTDYNRESGRRNDRRTSRDSGEGRMMERLERIAREDRNAQRRELAQDMMRELKNA